MGIYTLQTKEGDVDAVAFPSVYESIRDRIEDDGIYGFRGTFRKKEGDTRLSFTLSSVCSPYELKPEAISMVHIQIRSGSDCRPDELKEIGRMLQDHEGFTPVSFTIEGNRGEELRAGGMYQVNFTRELIGALEEIPLVRKVWIS